MVTQKLELCMSFYTECETCVNLQELPKTTPVRIKLPSELFGDMMMVLEFLSVFGNLFDIKDEFPSGLTFGKNETTGQCCKTCIQQHL